MLSLIAYWYCSDDFPTWTGAAVRYWHFTHLFIPREASSMEPLLPPGPLLWLLYFNRGAHGSPLKVEDFKNYTRAVCCSKYGDCKKKVGNSKGFLYTSWSKINLQPQIGFWIVFAVMFHIVSHDFSCSYGSEPTTVLWHTVQTHLLPYVENTICHELFLSIHKSLLLLQKIITIMGKQSLNISLFLFLSMYQISISFT